MLGWNGLSCVSRDVSRDVSDSLLDSGIGSIIKCNGFGICYEEANRKTDYSSLTGYLK